MNNLKTLEHHETNDFVITTAKKALKLINEEVAKIDQRQQWLLLGRIINIIFASLYKPALEQSEKIYNQNEGDNHVKSNS